ncbi:hypothetical protein A0H81_09585 [Grifola frondosa]|uniref:Uncharacterized protein n=1 Tax=Grifola frondosa TaxID=5627 RepID=A0A1C7M4Q9_GRIFR|nr:hypothetical protein A0H81_09585 [Grifola frondosa]
MPNLLHQLHKGFFKDHTILWAIADIAEDAIEVNYHFKAMLIHSTLQHFKKDISLVSQWIETEYKNMEKVFLGILTNAPDLIML